MNAEYLIFNLVVLSGPLSLSFDKRVHFVDKWPSVAKAIFPTMTLFIVWDALVTGKHWWFNHEYTLSFRFANLPLGEWLFFFAVPYACLFVWEVFAAYFKNNEIARLKFVRFIIIMGMPVGIFIFALGKEYTGLTLIALGFVGLLDAYLKTGLFTQLRTYQLLGISMLFMLVFNGYLTWRPVVLYNEAFLLGFRIYTIPIEDFGYGFALILMNTILYEYFKGRQHG